MVAGNNFEGAIQQILDMGGGTWDRDTVVRALRAAYNNPERAVEYLYSVSSLSLLDSFSVFLCFERTLEFSFFISLILELNWAYIESNYKRHSLKFWVAGLHFFTMKARS